MAGALSQHLDSVLTSISYAGGQARPVQHRAASAAVSAQAVRQPGSATAAVRLISSASGVRHDAGYVRPPRPTTGVPEPQLSAAWAPPEPSRCHPASTAESDISGQRSLEQDSQDAVKPFRARTGGRRSIAGAALRVPRPDSSTAARQATAAVSMLDLPVATREQSTGARRPPVPMRKSSIMSASGRLSLSSGAAGSQGEVQSHIRTSAARASGDEGAVRVCCRTAPPLRRLLLLPGLVPATPDFPYWCPADLSSMLCAQAEKARGQARERASECSCRMLLPNLRRFQNSSTRRRMQVSPASTEYVTPLTL